jgi:pimeloyl-ACP methyl ester carboxylesterase
MAARKSALRAVVLLLMSSIVAGAIYEKIGEFRDRHRYPQIGRSVDIGGRTANIYCSGQGQPAVILESGGHTAGYSWIRVQPEVAKFTQACWYDRAGYGWSDPGPSPRTFQAIANDLHALLRAAGIAPPYVFVAATAGTFHIRVYNKLYPDEVAGAVLIEASDPMMFEHGEPQYMKGGLSFLPPAATIFGCNYVVPPLVRIGLIRLLGNPGAGRPYALATLDHQQQQELLFLSNNPSTARTEGEGCVLDEGLDEVRAAGGFGSRPLVILESPHRFLPPPAPQYLAEAQSLNAYWEHQVAPHLAALSERGRYVEVQNPDASDVEASTVNDVVSEVRTAGQH